MKNRFIGATFVGAAIGRDRIVAALVERFRRSGHWPRPLRGNGIVAANGRSYKAAPTAFPRRR